MYPLDSAAFIARTVSSDVTDSPAHSSSLKFVPMHVAIAQLLPKVDVLSCSLRGRKNIFNKGLKRDMTFPVIPNIFHGSTFIIPMKLSVFVN